MSPDSPPEDDDQPTVVVGSLSVSIPDWLFHCGLAERLREETGSPLAWFLFLDLVTLDCSRNPIPGVVELTLKSWESRTGMEGKSLLSTIKKLRKAGLVRCFLPDNEEESALFQIITPLSTPIPWRTVWDAHYAGESTNLGGSPGQLLRYAETPLTPEFSTGVVQQNKFQQVLDLYLNLVSMKLNQFVQDELLLISEFYDTKMIRKMFLRAREQQIQNLGWIIRQIREENLRLKANAALKGTPVETEKGDAS